MIQIRCRRRNKRRSAPSCHKLTLFRRNRANRHSHVKSTANKNSRIQSWRSTKMRNLTFFRESLPTLGYFCVRDPFPWRSNSPTLKVGTWLCACARKTPTPTLSTPQWKNKCLKSWWSSLKTRIATGSRRNSCIWHLVAGQLALLKARHSRWRPISLNYRASLQSYSTRTKSGRKSSGTSKFNEQFRRKKWLLFKISGHKRLFSIWRWNRHQASQIEWLNWSGYTR